MDYGKYAYLEVHDLTEKVRELSERVKKLEELLENGLSEVKNDEL